MANHVVALVGGFLCLSAGCLIGYGVGAESTIAQITGLISGAAGLLPSVGTAAGSSMNSYLEQQLAGGYDNYYLAGGLLALAGLGFAALGGRSKKVKAAPQVTSTAAPASSELSAGQLFCKYCGAKNTPKAQMCVSCGRYLV